ncbi:MAG: T9SS type A sorting domain-containing protein [FCB group bacterium]|nr:T9SS type A sorting domain-containing protein [FCB group bacterium]
MMKRMSVKNLMISLILLSSFTMADWQAQDVGLPEAYQVVAVSPVDANTIWVAGGLESVSTPYLGYSRTTDGGSTWQCDSISVTGMDLDDFFIVHIFAHSDSIAWAVLVYDTALPHQGRIVKTVDAGNTWVAQLSAYPDIEGVHNGPDFIHFFDENHGLTVGDLEEMYITSNGGDDWTRVPSSSYPTILANEDPYNASYTSMGDSSLAFGTNSGRVFVTHDRGASWTASNVGLGPTYIWTTFQDEFVGLATAPVFGRQIAKTIDGGNTWTTLSAQTPTNAILSFVKGSESTYMYASAGLPGILGSAPGNGFTSDFGTSWEDENSTSLFPAVWSNGGTGWAGQFEDNKIYRWMTDTIPPAIPTDLLLWSQIDGPFYTYGLNWDSPVDEDFSFFRLYSSTTDAFSENVSLLYETPSPSYVFSDYPSLYYRVTSVDINGNESDGSEIVSLPITSVHEAMEPAKFSLNKNFPNPFNPSTTIRYGLREESHVSLVIYDVRGQVIQTLESGHQPAGWYDVTWSGETPDGHSISTGIYFARLVAGEYSHVIKMLYVK